jgi:hypothetical protein
MSHVADPTRRRLTGLLLFLLGAALFAVAYCQAPLYYSNQNQYFLHGLANAGEGLLREDWLANTRDPTPIFSGLVTFTAEFLHPWVFYVEYGLLFGAYAAAMVSLFAWLAGPRLAAQRWLVFVAQFVLLHAALPRWCSYRWLGRDYPWYFQAGLAGQYLLGPMFQPSTFGVLLVVAIALFIWGRPFAAAVFVALAGTIHSTYLLPGAMLILGFMTALAVQRRPYQALAVGALALVLVLPVTFYVVTTFGPTSPEKFAEAQDITANFRIPHHSRPDLWIDLYAVLQMAWVVLALFLARRTPLLAVLGVPLALGVVLTLVQVTTGSNTLALLFPWRVSTVLVPVATTVILSRLVALPVLPLEGVGARTVSALVLAGLVGGGLWISVGRLALRAPDEEQGVMDFVRRTVRSGDVYYLPVRLPNLAKTTRGAQSSDFKPLAEKKGDVQIIPVDLQRFRLGTGAPIFVDFKSIPYQDIEVIAWRQRLAVADAIHESLRAGRFDAAIAELRRQNLLFVVWPAGQELRHPGLMKFFDDGSYQVYLLTAAFPF